jgi:hypothetical protein
MTGLDGDGSGLLADQIYETRSYLVRCMPVVGERQNTGRILAADPDQVGYAVHQNPRFA